MHIIRYLLVYLFILPKFVIWPLLILHRFYLKKKGIENDFITRQVKSLRCFAAARFPKLGSLALIRESLGLEFEGLADKFLQVLLRGEGKSALELGEDFRETYPQDWRNLTDRAQETWGEGFARAIDPAIFFCQLLKELEREHRVIRLEEEREIRWKARPL